MPGFHVKFGVLAVGDHLPSSGEHLIDGGLDVQFVGSAVGEAVDSRAERNGGIDDVGGV